jgi:hypothetical protein
MATQWQFGAAGFGNCEYKQTVLFFSFNFRKLGVWHKTTANAGKAG